MAPTYQFKYRIEKEKSKLSIFLIALLVFIAFLVGAILWALLAPEPELPPPPEPVVYWVSSTGKVHNETCRFARKFMEKNKTEDCDYCGGRSRNQFGLKKLESRL